MKDKKIIGYKVPYDLFNGIIKKDYVYIKSNTNFYHCQNNVENSYLLPKEIVESWEPVYFETQEELVMFLVETIQQDKENRINPNSTVCEILRLFEIKRKE